MTVALALATMAIATGPFTVRALAQQPAPAAPQATLAREGAAIIVDDEPISTYQQRQRMLWISLSSGRTPSEADLPDLQRQALLTLIDEMLQKHEIMRQEHERKLAPGTLFAHDDEVDDYLKMIAQQNQMALPQFVQTLEAAGLSPRTMREQARIAVTWQNWIRGYYGSKVRISDDEANAVIRDMESSASKPQYLVSEIFISAEHVGGQANAMSTANAIIGQLRQQPDSFRPLAFQYSALPSAANGGDSGWMSLAQLPAPVASVIDQMRPGQVTVPIQVPDGVYLVLLRDKKAGSTSTVVNLKQIAVPLGPNADAALAQAAQARLVALKPQIKGCDTIDQTARAAGLQVGDLGQADTKDLAPAFRNAIEGLQPNQVSDPIRTDAGLHLVALCGRAASGTRLPSRDEIKSQLYGERLSMIATRELRNLHNAATINAPK